MFELSTQDFCNFIDSEEYQRLENNNDSNDRMENVSDSSLIESLTLKVESLEELVYELSNKLQQQERQFAQALDELNAKIDQYIKQTNAMNNFPLPPMTEALKFLPTQNISSTQLNSMEMSQNIPYTQILNDK